VNEKVMDSSVETSILQANPELVLPPLRPRRTCYFANGHQDVRASAPDNVLGQFDIRAVEIIAEAKNLLFA
jgi:hypothetical protein